MVQAKVQAIRAKLHGLRVTGADLEYHGSITLDPEHCALAGIYPLEFVDIWNKNSGARLSTYVIYGEPGSRCCVLNGAAARTCQAGDEVIIAASAFISPDDLYNLKPQVLTFDDHNRVTDVLSYDVSRGKAKDHPFEFRVLHHEEAIPVPVHTPKSRWHNVDLKAVRRDLAAQGMDIEAQDAFMAAHFPH